MTKSRPCKIIPSLKFRTQRRFFRQKYSKNTEKWITAGTHYQRNFLELCAVVVLWTCVIIEFFVAYYVVDTKLLFIYRHCLVLFVVLLRHWVWNLFFHEFTWELLWMRHLYDPWRKQFLAILPFLTSVLWTSWIMSLISNVCHCTSRTCKDSIHWTSR